METEGLLAPLIFVVFCLLAGAVMKYILKRSSFPYTVGLFCLGIGIGILDRTNLLGDMPILKTSIDAVGNMNPDLILYIFLPLLIFDAAYELNMHIFKKTLTNASLLAAPGMVIAMFLTGALVMAIAGVIPGFEEWNWSFALMFGALISATDPVAVVALLRELGTSKRFSTLVDAESMLNDGTGIVLFMLFFGVYSASVHAPENPVVEFFVVMIGSVLLGLLLARITIWFIQKVEGDALVQNSVIIMAAYVTFFLAQGTLAISGVIALVAFGLTISYVGKPKLKTGVNRFMDEFWELTAYIANTLIFIIVGIVIALKVDFSWTNLAALFLIYIGVNVVRAIMIAILYPVMKRCGYGLSFRESVILTWGGLRGALGLTLALMVSYTLEIPEDVRSQVLFFTAGIVTLTLTINATSTRWLLNKLGLVKVPSAKVLLDYSIRERVREDTEKYYEKLQKRDALADANWYIVERFLPKAEEEPDRSVRTQDMLADIRLRILDKEKQLTRKMYAEGTISPNTFRRLSVSLDEQYDHDGKMPLSVRKSIFSYYNEPFYRQGLKRIPYLRSWLDRYFHEWVINAYDLGRGFVITQRESQKVLAELVDTGVVVAEKQQSLHILSEELEQNITRIADCLVKLKKESPISYRCALTRKAIRMLLSNERRTVNQLLADGLIAEKDAESLLANVDDRYSGLSTFNINRIVESYEQEQQQSATKTHANTPA